MADITGSNLTVVGRSKILGTQKQLCHIIPVAFIKAMVASAVEEAANSHELIEKLSLILATAAKSQSGFAIKSSDLELPEYNTITFKLPDCADRVLSLGKENIFLASPSKQKTLFSTPTKMKKAVTEFQEYNTQFIKLALNKLSELIQDDNTAVIISELLTRYIFDLPNSGKNTVFAPEGNTVRYEIRLYDDKEQAKQSGKGYSVVTAKELFVMNNDSLNQCIRIVNSEGPKVKSCIKALKELKNILISLDHSNDFVTSYNTKYNTPIKLSNYEKDLSDYNNLIIEQDSLEQQIAYHIAKNLYLAFDLKALENIVFVPGGHIPVYISAEGSRIVKYSFKSGNDFRQEKMDESDYSDDRFFRSAEKDLELLPQKLAELFLIGTSPFASYQANHIGFFDLCLSKLIDIAAKDYRMDMQSTKMLSTQVQYIYKSILPPSELGGTQSSTVLLLGEDYTGYNEFLGFTSDKPELVGYIL